MIAAPRVGWTLLVSLAAAACEDALPDIDWQRMLNQAHLQAYESSRFFPDGRAMQQPPAGTVPVTHASGPSALLEGRAGATYVESVPIAADHSLLKRGQNRYEFFCSPCHGLTGTGESLVAHNMTLRKPPSLVAEPVRSFPVGRVFEVITQGYGLMPAYRQELPVQDRWAVVAYLRALQRSQGVELSALPPAVRAHAEEALR
ncbi:MAG TPA: cytochrome c [Polyangiaceae bacterium]|nr:cytochrome c [Polyangiaceae bacterium]